MLARNIRVEEDLIDQLASSSEKRSARTLLCLAGFGTHKQPDDRIPPAVSQNTLAEMIGTTRSRINFFTNKFRARGFIKYSGYNGNITVGKSLLKIAIHE